MSDINQLLSLLKDHKLILPDTAQLPSSSSVTASSAPNTAPSAMAAPQQQQLIHSTHTATPPILPASIPMNIDFSCISQEVINQVRAEYLHNSKKEDEQDQALKNATSVTSEVLVELGRLMKETKLLQVLKGCKERQHRKERDLFAQRQAIEARFKKQKDALLTKEMLGVKVDPKEPKDLEDNRDNELHMMDLQVLKEMDKEVTYLQREFVRLNVPLFKITQDPKELKLQQRVLNILHDDTSSS